MRNGKFVNGDFHDLETFTGFGDFHRIWRLSQDLETFTGFGDFHDLETFTGFGDFQSVARFMPHSSRVFLDSDTFLFNASTRFLMSFAVFLLCPVL